jgi:alanine-glyoxylate transaminase/serine-glyoxylate transaminase/serine-pyruvate transaminase
VNEPINDPTGALGCRPVLVTDRILMGPGPSNPYPAVAQALARPMLGHLDPDFLSVLDETNERLRSVFRTANPLTFPVSGTGSAGMEAAFVNVVSPGDPVVIGVNGLFGERMVDVAGRCGAEVIRVDAPWGQPLDPQAVLDAHPSPRLIAVVHAETSTGVRNDVAALGFGKGDALLLVDCVTSLGGIPVEIDGWSVDLAYSGTQKCLGEPPGLAHHHTAPVAMIFALHAGLGAVLDEGLEASWARHRACGQALQDGLEQQGWELFAEKDHRLPELTTVLVPLDRLPAGMSEADARAALLSRYGIEVGGGVGELAGRVWRIGCMGHTARPRNVAALLGALEELFAG